MGQRVKIVGITCYPDDTFGHIKGIDVECPFEMIASEYDGLFIHVETWPDGEMLWFHADIAHKHLEAVD